MTTDRINLTTPFPSVLSIEGKDRVLAFLARHGGSAPMVEREGDRFEDTSGWSEVSAGDGYRLRCDWTGVGSRCIMSFVEIAAGESNPPADMG